MFDFEDTGFPKQIVRFHRPAVSDGRLVERLDIMMLLKDRLSLPDDPIQCFHEVLVPPHDVADNIPNRPFPLLDGRAKNILRARH